MSHAEAESFDPFEGEFLYQELRKLAAKRLANEPSGQTLDATGLVHEAYLRLFSTNHADRWVNEAHFFASAAEAMRRILVDNARRKRAIKRGGEHRRVVLPEEIPHGIPFVNPEDELIELDAALDQLQIHDARKASVVKLRYFAGLTTAQIATTLEIATSTVDADWAYAKAWLKVRLNNN